MLKLFAVFLKVAGSFDQSQTESIPLQVACQIAGMIYDKNTNDL